ncbi:hypothetical protein [Nonomuraea jabiensis]|uniref:hypothetical protein n=1 Tax=Nonomuraea jabiensis TaxID=882448 RepID=UPI003D71560D
MHNPPPVHILPDPANDPRRPDDPLPVGSLLELQVDATGKAVAAFASWGVDTPGPRGGLELHEEWLPINRVRQIPGQDYTKVPRTPTASPAELPPNDPGATPHGWPAGLAAPGTPGWEQATLPFLFDILPPDYRAHMAVFTAYPEVLAHMAALHLDHVSKALTNGLRGAAVELKPFLPPHVLSEITEVYRLERARLADLTHSVEIIEKALRTRLRETDMSGSFHLKRRGEAGT